MGATADQDFDPDPSWILRALFATARQLQLRLHAHHQTKTTEPAAALRLIQIRSVLSHERRRISA